jgi:hypothetical protein
VRSTSANDPDHVIESPLSRTDGAPLMFRPDALPAVPLEQKWTE